MSRYDRHNYTSISISTQKCRSLSSITLIKTEGSLNMDQEHAPGTLQRQKLLRLYRLITNEILVSDLLTQVPEGKSSKEHTQDSTRTRLQLLSNSLPNRGESSFIYTILSRFPVRGHGQLPVKTLSEEYRWGNWWTPVVISSLKGQAIWGPIITFTDDRLLQSHIKQIKQLFGYTVELTEPTYRRTPLSARQT